MKGIVLIGFMGAGKTTIGRLLAERLQLAHVDFDDLIVESIGMTIQDYFDRYGEAAFREKETEILTHSLILDQVISTGGGIILKRRKSATIAAISESRLFKNGARRIARSVEKGYGQYSSACRFEIAGRNH